MQRLADVLKRKLSPPAAIEMYLVHQRSKAPLASRAVAPGVQALAWQDFVRELCRYAVSVSAVVFQRAELEARVAVLEAQLAQLQSQLARSQKHSGNSSKPPSSDIVKPPKKRRKPGRPKKRKIGGQPGHPRHLRTPFAPEELDRHWVWAHDECPCCGGRLNVDETGHKEKGQRLWT